MDPDKRIEELEAQVRQLSEAVEALRFSREPAAPTGQASETPPSVESSYERGISELSELVSEVRTSVERALGGESDEPLETRIGGIWLSRFSVLFLMTFIALGFNSEEILPWQKVCFGYALAAAGILYGVYYRAGSSAFPKTILGAGLAIVYFTTYAAFFVPSIHVFTVEWAAVPALLTCLLFLVVMSHWQRSQTTAGIALFLVYYTVVAQCTGGLSSETVLYALVTCTVLAIVAFAFHAWHRWMLFSWVALFATYATYIFYFVAKPAALSLSDNDYFWFSNGFLTLCYLLFAAGCIIDARRTGEYRRFVAPLAGLNSLLYFTLTWLAIRQVYPAQEWMFRLAFAGGLALLTVFAETTGPHRNYLFQIFIAKTVIMSTLAIQSLLTGEKLLIAFAIECLALAIAYKRSGVVLFKVLDHTLMLIVFMWSIVCVKLPGTVVLGAYSAPANWVGGLGVVAAFAVTAWFYELFAHGLSPERRKLSGQWFLADSALDVHNTTAAVLHATLGTIILLTLTIIDRGDDPRLPYLLAGEAVLMAVAGFLLRTPQIEVASVLLLVAAHVSYHFFLALDKPGFETQAAYVPQTIAVACVTYLGAYLWERYLKRIPAGRPWEHYLLASIPYLVATYLLTTLVGRALSGIHAPLAQNALGVALLLVGSLVRMPAVKGSGLLALGIGSVTFCFRLYFPPTPIVPQPHFPAYLALLLATYACAERLFVILQHQEHEPSPLEDRVRSVLVLALLGLGILGLWEWTDAAHLTVYWLGHGVVTLLIGALVREWRYRWAGLLAIAVAIGHAFSHDIFTLPAPYNLLSTGALAITLLIVSWGYSRFRQRASRKTTGTPTQRPSSNG